MDLNSRKLRRMARAAGRKAERLWERLLGH